MYKAFQIHIIYFSNLIIYSGKETSSFLGISNLGDRTKNSSIKLNIPKFFSEKFPETFLGVVSKVVGVITLPQLLNKYLNRITNLKLELYFLSIPCPWININQNRHPKIIIFIRICRYRRNSRISRFIEFSDCNIINRITNYTKLTQFIDS